jgi:hypothetical protein
MSAETITLPPQLLSPLQQIAREKGQSVEAVVEDLVRDFLRDQRHAHLLVEMERFRAQHAELLARFPSQYVGMRDGQVLDHDPDGGLLYARLRRQYGELPILIVQVTQTPEQEITVLSPKLETGA